MQYSYTWEVNTLIKGKFWVILQLELWILSPKFIEKSKSLKNVYEMDLIWMDKNLINWKRSCKDRSLINEWTDQWMNEWMGEWKTWIFFFFFFSKSENLFLATLWLHISFLRKM